MTAKGPTLIEQVTDDLGTYTLRWHCDPPPEKQPFRVVREEWDNDLNVRDIYEWTLP